MTKVKKTKFKRKILLLSWMFMCLCLGIFDFSHTAQQQFLVQLNTYTIFYVFGMSEYLGYYPPIDAGIITWVTNPRTQYINAFCFLVAAPATVLITWRYGGNRYYTRRQEILFMIAGALLMSVAWDTAFVYMVNTYVSPLAKGDIVHWLPLVNGSNFNYLGFGLWMQNLAYAGVISWSTFGKASIILPYILNNSGIWGVSFNWGIGYTFIVIRLLAALVILRRLPLKKKVMI